MKIETKAKIIYGTSAVFMLAAIFFWWRYTERTFWGFLGYLFVGMIAGKLLGWVGTLPFKDEEPTAKERYDCSIIRWANAIAQVKIAENDMNQAKELAEKPA